MEEEKEVEKPIVQHSHHPKEETITFSKNSLWRAGTFVFAILFVASLLGVFGGGDSGIGTGAVVAPTNPTPTAAPSPTPTAQVEIGDDAVKGESDAPVTIIEFSDYECPFCGRFYTETLPQIRARYIDTGKVKYVFRDFPLSFHPNAQKAAEAAECAGEQGKYFEMHDKLFDNQQALDVNSLKNYASQIDLDMGEFNSCLDSGKMAEEISKDLRDGQAAGVQGTPAFFINGRLVSGAQPFAAFQQAIEAELA
ncbi:MAG: DsbA family protein [Nanoarchaeota archaeon]|nr:DsbA family protein [Nanoarchaeota archaeon]